MHFVRTSTVTHTVPLFCQTMVHFCACGCVQLDHIVLTVGSIYIVKGLSDTKKLYHYNFGKVNVLTNILVQKR